MNTFNYYLWFYKDADRNDEMIEEIEDIVPTTTFEKKRRRKPVKCRLIAFRKNPKYTFNFKLKRHHHHHKHRIRPH